MDARIRASKRLGVQEMDRGPVHEDAAAYEPLTDATALLERTIQLNNVPNHVHASPDG